MKIRAIKMFCQQYDHIFREDPISANLFLLLTEIADRNGQVKFNGDPGEELAALMAKRFDDPTRYQL